MFIGCFVLIGPNWSGHCTVGTMRYRTVQSSLWSKKKTPDHCTCFWVVTAVMLPEAYVSSGNLVTRVCLMQWGGGQGEFGQDQIEGSGVRRGGPNSSIYSFLVFVSNFSPTPRRTQGSYLGSNSMHQHITVLLSQAPPPLSTRCTAEKRVA